MDRDAAVEWVSNPPLDWFSTDHTMEVVIREKNLSMADWHEAFSDHLHNPSPYRVNLRSE